MNKAIWAGGAAICVLGLAVAMVSAGPARAAVGVFANDHALDCYIAAKFGDKERRGLEDCRAAMVKGLTKHEIAGILVNRGIIYVSYERYPLAMADFNAAINLDASVGDAYVNRGMVLITQKQFVEGRADTDRGILLGSDEPEKAYYNRGLADDYLNDEKAAYFDYLKASQLDPNWAAPQVELTRFTVTPK